MIHLATLILILMMVQTSLKVKFFCSSIKLETLFVCVSVSE